MDSLNLLTIAREAGLTVRVDGDKLVVRGPKASAALAREVLEHKAEVMAALGPPAPPQAEAAPVDADDLRDDDADDGRSVPAPPRKCPPPPTDPGGYCTVHKRLLTYREQMAGGCSWCSGAVQLDRPVRAPVPRTCLECRAPLPPGNKYFCWGCVAARAEHAEKELPF
jgi:hypothetical protein